MAPDSEYVGLVTVDRTDVDRVVVPSLPVIVTVEGPAGVVDEVVMHRRRPDPYIYSGVNVALVFAGRPVAASVTCPANPAIAAQRHDITGRAVSRHRSVVWECRE